MWPWLCIIQLKWIPAVCCRGVVVSSDFFVFLLVLNEYLDCVCVLVSLLFVLVESNKSHWFGVRKRSHSNWIGGGLSLSHAHNLYESNYTAMHRIALIGLTNTQSIILRIKFKSLFFRFVSFILFWCFVAVVVFIIFLFLFFFLFLFVIFFYLRFAFSSLLFLPLIFFFFSEFSLYKAHLMAFMMIGLALRFHSHAQHYIYR